MTTDLPTPPDVETRRELERLRADVGRLTAEVAETKSVAITCIRDIGDELKRVTQCWARTGDEVNRLRADLAAILAAQVIDDGEDWGVGRYRIRPPRNDRWAWQGYSTREEAIAAWRRDVGLDASTSTSTEGSTDG